MNSGHCLLYCVTSNASLSFFNLTKVSESFTIHCLMYISNQVIKQNHKLHMKKQVFLKITLKKCSQLTSFRIMTCLFILMSNVYPSWHLTQIWKIAVAFWVNYGKCKNVCPRQFLLILYAAHILLFPILSLRY